MARPRADIGVYPKLMGFPLGVFIIAILMTIIGIFMAIITFHWLWLLISILLWLIGFYLNTKFDGNFFYSKPLPQHDYIFTRNFIMKLNQYECKSPKT